MLRRSATLTRWVVALASCGGCSHTPSKAFEQLRDLHGQRGLASDWQGLSSVFEHALSVDDYVCRPSPRDVFFGTTTPGLRVIRGSMPHYDLYHGPMQYVIRRRRDSWQVSAFIGVTLTDAERRMQLPDCRLAGELEGGVECSGQALSSSDSLEICPDVGRFSAPLTKTNVSVLLRQWSREVERYYNRDARAQGIPVVYDFNFELVEEPATVPTASLVVPFEPSCGRTPYFHSIRSGWSLPIIAHEVGHVLGLLDEYEMFSGIVDFYPKTPFPGAEHSRMGLSMRENTVVLPMHHYLILRRYFCTESTPVKFGVSF